MQGVLVFASAAARAAAITSPQEGQYSYLKDTNSTEYYDGAAWIAAPIGDITGVTAGTGISGGGTSGTVTITNSMATEIAAKGDLIVGTGAATFDNLTVGANGTTLVADSTAATGLKWAAAGTSFSGALATKSTSQSITGATNTLLTFDTESYGFDTATYHDNTTNNSRMTVPTTGYYRITACVTFDATNNSSYRNVNLLKNGTAVYQSSQGANGVDWTNIPISFVASATASDYFELQVYAPPNPTVVMANNTYVAATFFSVQYLGA
jgi:hypothetical protein